MVSGIIDSLTSAWLGLPNVGAFAETELVIIACHCVLRSSSSRSCRSSSVGAGNDSLISPGHVTCKPSTYLDGSRLLAVLSWLSGSTSLNVCERRATMGKQMNQSIDKNPDS